jgi:hypothetical protein
MQYDLLCVRKRLNKWHLGGASILAFNNAGLALPPDSLSQWIRKPIVSLVIPALFFPWRAPVYRGGRCVPYAELAQTDLAFQAFAGWHCAHNHLGNVLFGLLHGITAELDDIERFNIMTFSSPGGSSHWQSAFPSSCAAFPR